MRYSYSKLYARTSRDVANMSRSLKTEGLYLRFWREFLSVVQLSYEDNYVAKMLNTD